MRKRTLFKMSQVSTVALVILQMFSPLIFALTVNVPKALAEGSGVTDNSVQQEVVNPTDTPAPTPTPTSTPTPTPQPTEIPVLKPANISPLCTTPVTLKIIKNVINNYGENKSASNFTLHLLDTANNNVQGSPFFGSTLGTSFSLPFNGNYKVTEDPGNAYTASFSGACDSNGNVKLTLGNDNQCTVTNSAVQPKLTVVKKVLGSTRDPSTFPLFVDTQSVTLGQTQGFNVGDYTVWDTDNIGFTASYSSDCPQGNVSLALGDNKTCTITNTRDTGSLEVKKQFDANNDGIYEGNSSQANALGMNWSTVGNAVSNAAFGYVKNGLATDNYAVTENSTPDYHFTGWYLETTTAGGSCIQPAGTQYPVTITVNKDPQTTLVLCNVHNTGGLVVQKVVADYHTDLSQWSFALDNGAFKPANSSGMVDFGQVLTGANHIITESGPQGYHFDSITGTNCSSNTDNTATAKVLTGQTTYCTFSNLADKAAITVVKDAQPDSSTQFNFSYTYGTQNPFIFKLKDVGHGSTNARTFTNLVPAQVVIKETVPSDWFLVSVNCVSNYRTLNGQSNPVSITLLPGESMVCTYTDQKGGELKAFKYNDVTANGEFNFGDFPLMGWNMQLYSGSNCAVGNLIGSPKSTNLLGFANFNDLKPGDYSIYESGLLTHTDWANVTPACQNVHLDTDGTEIVSFGNFHKTSIEGYKYNDLDGDGKKDWNETGLSGLTIILYKYLGNNSWGSVGQTTTDSSGHYEFDNLSFGKYQVIESVPDGWQVIKPADGFYTDVELTSGCPKILNFFNQMYATITVQKNTEPAGSDQLFNFDLKLGDYTAHTYNLRGTDNANTESYTVHQSGTYSLMEQPVAGWVQDSVNCVYLYRDGNPEPGALVIQPGDRIYCTFTNQQLGKITVTKFNDVNGNKSWDDGEQTLPDWQVTLMQLGGSDNVVQTTGNEGTTMFSNLPFGSYQIGENMQSGWVQTTVYCDRQEVKDLQAQSVELPGDVYIGPGDNVQCYIGNQYPLLNITKTNNAPVGGLYVGQSATYTLHVSIPDENNGIVPAVLNEVNVTDLPSNGFIYRLGSWVSLKNGIPDPAVTEPSYHFPGVWSLGQLKPGEEFTLSYVTDLANTLNVGTYPDLAWAQGDLDPSGATVYAQDPNTSSVFVGTDTKVIALASIVPAQVVIGEIYLPRTGSDPAVAVIAGSLALLGLALISAGLGLRLKRKSLRVLLPVLAIPVLFGIGAGMSLITVSATSSLSVRLEQPASPSRLSSFNLTFVALDLSGAQISVDCYAKDPANTVSLFQTVDMAHAGGNSATCQVTSAMTHLDGNYEFYVKANSVQSNTVNVSIDRVSPQTPVAYSKESLNTCTYRLHFTTAADGRTSSVEIFRSQDTTFMADASTLKGTVVIGPNTSGTFDNTVPSCGETYYYVIRAVDALGNRSGFIGDNEVIIITPTPTVTSAPTGTIVPGPTGTVTGTPASSGVEGNGQNNGNPTVSPEVSGGVLGQTQTDNTPGGNVNFTYVILATVLGVGVLGGIVYALSRRKV